MANRKRILAPGEHPHGLFNPSTQEQRRIGWDARQAEVDELRKRVAELETELMFANGDGFKAGYAACEAAVSAYLEGQAEEMARIAARQSRGEVLAMWCDIAKLHKHRGAAAPKDGGNG